MSVKSNANSCLMTAKWDYANESLTGLYSDSREIYRYNTLRLANGSGAADGYGFEIIETRNKVRGSGKAIVLRFESSTGKDFDLLGWALDLTTTTQG